MSRELLDAFGELLVRSVRDEAITDWDMTLDGLMKDQESQEIARMMSQFGKEVREFIRSIVPRIVDTTLYHALWTIEQKEELKVSFTWGRDQVEDIRSVSDGLTGELHTEDGWIARFSTQRHSEFGAS